MSEYLSINRNLFRQIPLSIDLPEELRAPRARSFKEASALPRIGYFARIAPEKGLLNLVRAVKQLHESGIEVELHAGGYLGKAHHGYMKQIEKESAFLEDRFRYIGSPDSQKEKLEFMRSLDIFSVPALFQEPKGLYLLEAMSQGIPVAQPAHGSYPELIESTGGGLLFEPGNIEDHARILKQLLESPEQRNKMGSDAQSTIAEKHTSTQASQYLYEICKDFIKASRGC
jgi:glycosyltransferase involved in cell wall biosynthesis